MIIIQMPRGGGKTTMLINKSAATGVRIVCPDSETKYSLIDKAKALGLNMPIPLTIEELKDSTIDECLIDELDVMIEKLLNCKVAYATHTE